MTRSHNCIRGNEQFSKTIVGLLYVLLSVCNAAGQETDSSGGIDPVACSPPADLNDVPSVGLFGSGTQIAYTSLPFSGSGNTTCWHLVTTANCSGMERLALTPSSSSSANMKLKLQILREVKVPLHAIRMQQHAFEVVNHVDVNTDFDLAEMFCSDVQQPQRVTISFAAKLEYSDGFFPGIYFKSTGEVGVAYGGKFGPCDNLDSLETPVTMWNRGKSQKEPKRNFSFAGATSEVCFQPTLLTVSVISARNDASSAMTPSALPTSPMDDAGNIIPAPTATPATDAFKPPPTTEVDGQNSANTVRGDVSAAAVAAATVTSIVFIATTITVILVIVGLLICRKQKVRGKHLTDQTKANIRADSMKPPIYAEIEGHPESSEVKYEDTVYSNVSDYLTPVSSGGTDTLSTIGEHHTMRTLPEAVTMDRSPCYGWVVPTLDQRKKLQQGRSTEAQHSLLAPCNTVSSVTGQPAQRFGVPDIEYDDNEVAESDSYWTPSMVEEEIYSQMHQWNYREIPRSVVALGNKLGEGQFGQVYSGQLESAQNGPAREIAVKLVKHGAPQEEKVKLLQEAAILGQFRHKHIVLLVGVVTLSEPKMIIMELVAGGDLRNYLIQSKQILVREGDNSLPHLPGLLLRFCHQVAEGLAFLARKSFVHRDIAARNILLDEELNCKISDFGMSRDLEEEDYYVTRGGKIPIKWTSPEAILYKKYSTSSDVWSYGMLMYEIWSLGHKPFPTIPLHMAIQILRQNQGYCQPPPPGCPRAVYAIMVDCWNPDHNARPSAIGVVVKLTQPESTLLAWTEEDKEAFSGGSKLGAPLEMGESLFKDLQETYS